jgi:hypothetical protein
MDEQGRMQAHADVHDKSNMSAIHGKHTTMSTHSTEGQQLECTDLATHIRKCVDNMSLASTIEEHIKMGHIFIEFMLHNYGCRIMLRCLPDMRETMKDLCIDFLSARECGCDFVCVLCDMIKLCALMDAELPVDVEMCGTKENVKEEDEYVDIGH